MTSKYVLVPEQQFRKWQTNKKSNQTETDKSMSITKSIPKKEDSTPSEKEPDTAITKSTPPPPPPGKPPGYKRKVHDTKDRVWKQW
jgi:hypothetical protein